jgi:hypothetical protein
MQQAISNERQKTAKQQQTTANNSKQQPFTPREIMK